MDEMTVVDVAPAETEEEPRRAPRWPIAAAVASFLVVGLAVVAWNITLPYYAMSPGPLYDVADFVTLDGQDAADLHGDLYMLTVTLQEVNPFEYLLGNLDSSVDLVGRTAVRPEGVTREEQREANLRSMEDSKVTAILVAMERLGYDVTVTGEGVLVSSLLEDVPAAEVLQVGDVIVAVEGNPVMLAADAVAQITANEIGDTITLSVERDGETLDVDVELVEHTTFEGQPMVGFLAETFHPVYHFPIDVSIDSQNIGGPSAGLMYTLAVMDVLSDEDLTKGWRIAGTGTIQSDGSVGSIGGIKQKVIAAQEAGAQYIFVPERNYEDAASVVSDDVQLVSVANIDDAIEFLADLPPA